MNGVSLNGVGLDGATLGSASLSSLTLSASKLSGYKNGILVSGNGLAGTVFDSYLSNGQGIKVRIDSAQALPSPNTDVWAYGVSYQTSGAWQKLCGVDAGNNTILAVPVNGTFAPVTASWQNDANRFTFGCRGTAIAKCVEMGYKPWKLVPGSATVTLQNHLSACTRMLRADYCGDGTSWTVTGTQINVYDGSGIQADTMGWPLEAEWNAGGARCVSPTTRLRWNNVSATPPACLSGKKLGTCGLPTDFVSPSTLLMDEYGGT